MKVGVVIIKLEYILLNIINNECGIMMDRCAELSQAIVNKTGNHYCSFI